MTASTPDPISRTDTATQTMIRVFATPLLASILAVGLLVAGCDRDRTVEPLTDDEIRELTEDQPEIFVEKMGTLTLEGIEDLYLGQSKDEAMEVLDDYCQRIQTFDGGWRHSDAVFKGCIIEEDGEFTTIRAGFWPFNDNELSTLEIQDQAIAQKVVRARFSQIADELTEDLPRRGILMMASERYKLLANWDDGLDEPAHITIGFHPP